MTNNSNVRPRRSFLFVPGSDMSLFPKAIQAKPDIVCIDLEDAIAPPDKSIARKETLEQLETTTMTDEVETLIRTNSLRTRDGWEDITSILASKITLSGLMLPKVKSADEVRLLHELLDEQNSPLRPQVIIETNEGLEECVDIAGSSSRIDALLFGGIDMAAELRITPNWNSLLYARSKLVHAAATHQIDLIDVPYLDLEDQEGLKTAAKLAHELGFTGKGAIHPNQLPIITEQFTPSKEEVEQAKKIIDAFRKAKTGLVVMEGKLIEKPVLRNMLRVLAIAERTNGS